MRARLFAASLLVMCCQMSCATDSAARQRPEAVDAGRISQSPPRPPPMTYCALGLAILHSRSPMFGRHFERLSRTEKRLPQLATIVGIEDAGAQPCADAMFSIIGEHDAEPFVVGPRIWLGPIDGGFRWGAGTRNLNPHGPDGEEVHSIELSGGISGLAYVVDGGWVLCNDCKLPEENDESVPPE